MTVFEVISATSSGGTSSESSIACLIDRIRVDFDDPNLVANAGLVLVGTLVVRLELERLGNGFSLAGVSRVMPTA